MGSRALRLLIALPVAGLLVLATPRALSVGGQEGPEAVHEPATPTPTHGRLARLAGTWDATMRHHGPGDPTESHAVETVEPCCGGLWLAQVHRATDDEGRVLEGGFEGRGLLGFDPDRGQVVATWVDSYSPRLLHLGGDMAADGSRMVLVGTVPDPAGGPALVQRHVHELVGPDERRFRLEILRPGDEPFTAIEVDYHRRGADPPDPGADGG